MVEQNRREEGRERILLGRGEILPISFKHSVSVGRKRAKRSTSTTCWMVDLYVVYCLIMSVTPTGGHDGPILQMKELRLREVKLVVQNVPRLGIGKGRI